MDIETRLNRLVSRNVRWLADQQVNYGVNRGGIQDPVRDRVIGDNYATEEFAAACSRLGNPDLRSSFRKAMSFHCRTTDGHPEGRHTEHYQHRRLGFADALQSALSDETFSVDNRWISTVESWRPKRNSSNCNWHMMNAVLGVTVDSLVNNRYHRIAARIDLAKTFLYWKPDGFFSDSFDPVEWTHVRPAYVPLAYHAYTAALLHRYWTVAGSKPILAAFKRAASSLASVTPANGHVAYRGRSAGHIFTYGVSVYAFLAAAVEFDEVAYYLKAEQLLQILEGLQDKKGRFPVVANEKAYDQILDCQADYAYHSVYNAHCAAWLARALDLPTVGQNSLSSSREANQVGTRKFQWAGLFDYQFPTYHAVISTGRGGSYDGALSIAMLDIDGELASLPPSSGETTLTGHTIGYFDGDDLLWSSTRTTGDVDALDDHELSGHAQYATPAGTLTEHRQFRFKPASIHIRSKLTGDLDTLEDDEERFEYRFSRPHEAPIDITFDQPSSRKSVETVLGNGHARAVTFRPSDVPLTITLTLLFD